MKEILLASTYLVGISEMILGVYFWATNSGNEIRRVMTSLFLVTGIWVIFSAAVAYSNDQFFILNGIVHIFGLLMVFNLVHLAAIYPLPMFRMDQMHRVLFYLPVLLFCVMVFSTHTLDLNYVGHSIIQNSGQVVRGEMLPIYNGYVLFLYLSAIILLIFRIKRFTGYIQRNLRLILGSVILGGLPAVIIDLIWPLVSPGNVPNFLFGVLATVVWLGTTTYIVTEK